MIANNPWLDFAQLAKAAKNKKVIYWGCGTWFEKTTKVFKLKTEYLVDSSKNQQGKAVHHGYDVKDPKTLRNLKNKGRHYIVITTSAFYEVIDQLKRYGFRPGTDFSITPVLKNFQIIEEILNHKQTVILSSSDAIKNSKTEGGGIYLYHTPSCKMEKKLSGVTRGFDRYKNNYFVVDALKGVRILDKSFKELDSFELPKQSVPHGLAIDAEKKLIYVVLCLHDKIGVYDMKSYKMVDEITLTDKFTRTGLYQHHMNDICLDGNFLYISMFSKTGNVQKYCFDGAIVEYDLDQRAVVGSVADDLWQPHSVRLINGTLCYLDSMRGELNIASHKVETRLNGFVRGLDFDGRYYYVGQSLHRYFDRMAGYSNNISMDCGFFMFDSASKACKFFSTPALNDVNTLKLLDPFPGVK